MYNVYFNTRPLQISRKVSLNETGCSLVLEDWNVDTASRTTIIYLIDLIVSKKSYNVWKTYPALILQNKRAFDF